MLSIHQKYTTIQEGKQELGILSPLKTFKVPPLKIHLLVFKWKNVRSVVLVLNQCSNARYINWFND